MVNKCCVPGCQSNYYCNNKSHYVTMFSFPKDTNVLKEWIKKIPRDNLVITKYTKVCIIHFEEKYICRYDEFPVAGGRSPNKVGIIVYY